MRDIIVCLLALILMFLVSVAIVKTLNVNLTLKECVRVVKKGIVDIVTALFTKEKVRHTFEKSLDVGFDKIIEPYMNSAFEIKKSCNLHFRVPCIQVYFVSRDNPTDDMLNDISQQLLLKFNHYLMARDLDINSFITYSTRGNEICFALYYTEFEEDKKEWLQRYKIAVAEQSDTNFGVLADDKLDEELKKLKKKC